MALPLRGERLSIDHENFEYALPFLPPRRTAFTLVEMLVAMAISLLLMAALAKAFNVIGVTMRESRSRVEMSSQLRTVGFRLNDELRRATALMRPPQSSEAGAGYFVYYDGPVSDATFLLSDFEGPQPGVEGATDYRPRSKYGDYDDYLAFTAVADGNSYFTGVVPSFVVKMRESELTGIAYFPAADPAALDRVVITSKYAEIIYWVAPLRDASGAIVDTDLNAVGPTGTAVSDGLPDQLRLYRRVLLIRPDLNLEATGRLATLPPAISLAMQIRNTTGSPRGPDPGWPENWRDIRSVYQDCDLSVRRPLNPGGLPYPITPAAAGVDDDGDGNAANDHGVVANSLGDLTLPQNRFGHVRVPGGMLGTPMAATSSGLTSMPLLDLSGADAHLSSKNPPSTRAVPPATSGFLNAIYELDGDRLGEDIVLTGLLGFDVRAFDPLAPVILHVGPDGAPGTGGTMAANFGAVGSDDLVLTPADPGFGVAMRSAPFVAGSPPSGSWTLASQGAFVDLDYVYKRGGAIRADASNTDDSNAAEDLFEDNLESQCSTPFSGFDTSVARATPFRFPLSYPKSGRVLWGLPGLGAATGPLFYQPAYDTWASDYEADGFNQGSVSGMTGTVWTVPWPSAGSQASTTPPWTNMADEGNNGIDEGGAPGADDPGEYETSPPYFAPLRAVQIRLRVEDTVTRQVRQMIVTEEFVD